MKLKKRIFTRIELNKILAVVGATILVSSSINFFTKNVTMQMITLFIMIVGLILAIVATIIRVEDSDERSCENSYRAGYDAANIIQIALTFITASTILFGDYIKEFNSSKIIFMILGALIMVRSIAFIKHEKAGE